MLAIMQEKDNGSGMMKINFKLKDKDEGYFVFAPCIYNMDRAGFSIGLELFGRRFFYLSVRF